MGKSKAYATNTAFAGSIPMPSSNAADIFIPNFQINPQVESIIDKVTTQNDEQYDSGELSQALKTSC